ncbi:MAG: rod shape-determining protein MreC [Candidatus Omnitrophota bacterium]|nr:MAG: rod shape-determining protein MreC [Candidatus Omnitrophota bacterium]
MYLPSKIRFKHASVLALFIFLLLLPFKDLIGNVFIFFSRQFLVIPRKISQKTETLKKKNLELILQLRAFKNLKEENERLRTALQFREERGADFIAAQVISFDPSSWRRIVAINVGTKQKIQPGLLAVDEEGYLVGKVIEAEAHYARVILIDDPDFSLPVFVGEDSFGLLKGTLKGARILYIENEELIKPNDEIWLRTPYSYSVIYAGQVKQVKRGKHSLFWEVQAKLFAKRPFLHTIYIVR